MAANPPPKAFADGKLAAAVTIAELCVRSQDPFTRFRVGARRAGIVGAGAWPRRRQLTRICTQRRRIVLARRCQYTRWSRVRQRDGVVPLQRRNARAKALVSA
jgi:hypothetical protein